MIDELSKVTREEDWAKVKNLLYRHWVTSSQIIYPAQLPKPWEFVSDEVKIANELLYPLAVVGCADSSVPPLDASGHRDISLKRLKETVNIDESKTRSGQICGKMFRNGEPNYSCKECATDSTCVLCYECFVNSAHMNHKYKMHTSLGSGYCDCGDKEAWSSDYACRLHSAMASTSEEEQDETAGTGLPPLIVNRLHRLSLITVKFAVNLLCWDGTDRFPDIINEIPIPAEQETNFLTILYNDETHTYEGVIRALTLSINECSETNAMRLATIVDREGRAIVASGRREECERIKISIENRTKKESNRRTQKTGPLTVKVFRRRLVSLQSLAIRLLGWCSMQAQEFTPFARILSEVLLYGCPDCDQTTQIGRSSINENGEPVCGHQPHVVYPMIFDRRLWKAARTAFHQLLMSTVLMDLEHKNIFGRLFIKNYGVIFDDFIDDDHEHSVSVTSITVQVFTVPTVAKRLISEENALDVCLRTLHKFCQRYLTASPYNPRLMQMNFTNDSYPAVLKRALYMLNDVGYLLTLVPKNGSEWTNALRENFIGGSHTFLRFLADMQSMDEVKRQSNEHQLMENEWETAFSIFLRMQEPLSLLLAWARTDAAVHMSLYLKSLQQMHSHISHKAEFKSALVRVEVNGHHAYCIPFEVAKNPVSVHQSLWRFMAGLLCAPICIMQYFTVDESNKFNINGADSRQLISQILDGKRKMNMNGIRKLLLEMPLRVLVLNAQAGAAQLWRRNGFSLVNQIHNYSSNICRTEMYDRDVQLIQIVGALMEPNKFLIRLLDRFGLAKWAEIGFEDIGQPPDSIEGTSQEENSKIFSILAEELFHLFIIILGERFSIGLSEEFSPQKVLEREVLHLLCTGPKPFSHIEKYVPNDPAIQRISLETAVRSVGDFKRPTSVSSGQFHLKETLRSQYNPFFWHYSKQMMSLAEQQQQKERAGMSRELKACPPPIPPQLTPFFAPITRIMESELFTKLLRVVFERIEKRSRFVSEALFYRALYLTGMALNEQENAHSTNRPFNFLQLARKEGIFDLLSRLQDKSEIEVHNDLLWWLLKTYTKVSTLYAADEVKDGHQRELTIKHKEKRENEEGEGKNAQKAAIAKRKRQLAMERMRQLQHSFKIQHIGLADVTASHEQGATNQPQTEPSSMFSGFDENEPAYMDPDSGFPVCCGIKKSRVELRPQPAVMCILCQEDEFISFDGNPMMCSAFIQNSQLFARHCSPTDQISRNNDSSETLSIFAPIHLPQELHVSTCSHLMHFSCYKNFIESVSARERARNRPHLLNSRMLNVDANEYLCPLCKRLSNCVLPVFPPLTHSMNGDVFGFSTDRPPELDRPATMETFENWVTELSALVTQPVTISSAPIKQPTKGHSRKRSHSERSLADLVKNGAQQQGSKGIPVGADGVAGPTTTGVSQSSVISLPSSLEAVTPLMLEQQNHPEGTRSTSSISSISDAIVGQIQALEPNMLNEGGAAIVQQLLTYVFGGPKKLIPKGINQTNVPSSIPHWDVLQPLLNALERTCKNNDTTTDRPLSQNLSSFSRFSELINVLRACSFLIRSIASVLEIDKKPLFGAFNTRQRDCLNAFIRLAALIPFNCQPSGLRVLISRMLSPLLAPPFEDKLGPGTSKGSLQRPSSGESLDQALRSEVDIMQIDMLTLSVELVMCIGWSWVDGIRVLHNMNDSESIWKVADGSIDELHAIRLTLLAHIFQVVELCEYNISENIYTDRISIATKAEEHEESQDSFSKFIDRLRHLFPHYACKWTRQSELALYKRIRYAVICFLRPLAILYNALTLVPPPESLKDPSFDNFVPLCRYLGIPSSLIEIFSGKQVEHLFQMWSLHSPHRKDVSIPSLKGLLLPLQMNTLIDLPDDFSQLINMAINFRCPEVDELTSSIPTLCLSCGKMLCSQSYCCQRTINGQAVGSCTYHLRQCRSYSGIFLRIRECQLICLLVTGELARGCFKPAPYVDEFGETDPGFRRGNPMRLNRDLYRKIQRQWMHQEFAEEILNQYELNHRNIAFEWHHF